MEAAVPHLATQARQPAAEPRLTWSRWNRYQTSFSLALAPAQPGIFALAEEVLAPGEAAQLGDRRMLAVFVIDQTDDLGRALSGLFGSASPWRERLASGSCFVRFAVVSNAAERNGACVALQQWLAASTDTAAAVAEQAQPHVAPRQASPAAHNSTEIDRPAPLPAGF